jgi:hypothetical protein
MSRYFLTSNPVAIFIASSVYRFLSTCLGVKEVIYRDIEHDTYGIMVSCLQSFMVLFFTFYDLNS